MVTTALCDGATLRATTLCIAITSDDPATTGSNRTLGKCAVATLAGDLDFPVVEAVIVAPWVKYSLPFSRTGARLCMP